MGQNLTISICTLLIHNVIIQLLTICESNSNLLTRERFGNMNKIMNTILFAGLISMPISAIAASITSEQDTIEAYHKELEALKAKQQEETNQLEAKYKDLLDEMRKKHWDETNAANSNASTTGTSATTDTSSSTDTSATTSAEEDISVDGDTTTGHWAEEKQKSKDYWDQKRAERKAAFERRRSDSTTDDTDSSTKKSSTSATSKSSTATSTSADTATTSETTTSTSNKK